MGEVFLATDTRLDRKVAIKVLPGEFASDRQRLCRFEQEAKTLASLDHSNILSIFEVGTHESAPYLVSQFLEGNTLREELKNGALPQRKAIDYALQIANGFAAAHAKGIVHRDLKPENIFITKDGRVKILDFGLAKLKDGGQRSAAGGQNDPGSDAVTLVQTTEPGVVLGTVGYMSPEQVRGEEADHRSDIFAFGCILYEMLSGRRAFRKETSVQTMNAILTEEPPDWAEDNPNSFPALERIVRRCLEKHAERRFQSASDLAFALEALSGSDSKSRVPLPLKVGASQTRKREVIAWSALALCLIIIAVLSLWPTRQSNPLPTSTLTALLPDGVTLALPASPTMLAISGDGRYLAVSGASTLVTGADRSGKYGIYLRDIEQHEFKPVAGGEFGFTPFFSDDGQTLGCTVDVNLYKVPMHGGQPGLIGRSDWTHGASWRGDNIVFNLAPAKDEGLRLIKSDGSGQQILTKPDSSPGEMNHFWPQILPGGNAVLFTVKVSGDHQKSKIAVESLKEKGRRVTIGEGAVARYAASGHIVYSQGGNLWAVPFDVQRLRVQGRTQRVRERLMINPFFGTEMFDISESDNGTLAYVPASSAAFGRQLVWADRSNQWTNLYFPPGAIANVSLSPNATRAAIAVGGTGGDIWTLDLNGNQPFKLIDDPRDDFIPRWSVDGQWIYFCSDRLGIPDIFRQRADDRNSKAEPILVREGSQWAPALHPDKKTMAFVDGNNTAPDLAINSDIMVLTDNNPEPQPFLSSPASEASPAFSPDGKWLAYISDRNERGKFEVYVTSFPSKGPEIPVSTGEGLEPLWSPVGNELFYLSGDALMVVEVDSKAGKFSRPRRLLTVPHTLRQIGGGSYDVTPDGQRFLMIQEEPDQPALKRITVVQNWFKELKRLAPPEP